MERGGVDARSVEQARELLAPEADARLRALLDQPLVIRARGRVGIDPAMLLPRTLAQCRVDETHPLKLKLALAQCRVDETHPLKLTLPLETARRKLAAHKASRARLLASLLEEHELVKFMAKEETQAAADKSRLKQELESAVTAEEQRLATIQARESKAQAMKDAQNERLLARQLALQRHQEEEVQEAVLQRKIAQEELLKRKRYTLEQQALAKKARRAATKKAEEA